RQRSTAPPPPPAAGGNRRARPPSGRPLAPLQVMRPLLRRAKSLPGKDAGSVRIRSDTGATEDAAWQSLAAAGGDGVECLKGRLQKPEAGREQPAGVGLPVRRRPAAEQLVFAAAPQGEGDPLPQRRSVTLVGELVLPGPRERDVHGALLL